VQAAGKLAALDQSQQNCDTLALTSVKTMPGARRSEVVAKIVMARHMCFGSTLPVNTTHVHMFTSYTTHTDISCCFTASGESLLAEPVR
jgi:hypothetical protein